MNKNNGFNSLTKEFLYKDNECDIVVSLVGNPNVGKSTIFNTLTGMNQHTGNWTGKTVSSAYGKYSYNDEDFILVDLPGTYSLTPSSKEEIVTRDFLGFYNPLITVLVIDATNIERNLILVLQTLEISDNVILCVNLMDEALKKNISVDLDILKNELNIPVIGISAANNNGIDNLKREIYKRSYENKSNLNKLTYNDDIETSISNIENYLNTLFVFNNRWLSIKLLTDDTINSSINTYLNYDISSDSVLCELINNEKRKNINIKKDITKKQISESARIYIKSVTLNNNTNVSKLDKILTSKLTGIPIMILTFLFIFYLTIKGANIPSDILSNILFGFEPIFYNLLNILKIPSFIINPVVYGMYRTLSWVVSVMLPPMALFFPLFTLLEDFGYLPRLAFNMDKLFNKAHSNGKQSLTMCMGIGCNACGVMGSRIIETNKERLIAILTNNFIPCNGRFPILITLISIFFTTNTFVSSIILILLIILSVIVTLIISKILSKLIKGKSSTFILELPPFRRPQIKKILLRSLLDRTLHVLLRAVIIAIPSGLVIWILSNTYIHDISLLKHISLFLDPFAKLFGLDGVILLSFILGFPANEIVIPLMIMTYMQTSKLEVMDTLSLKQLLLDNGWTYVTAICTMIFTLMHFPCGTTSLTIRKETNSIKWMIIGIIMPTVVGLILCFLVNTIFKFI